MSLFARLFGPADDRARLAPLYRSIVERAREPHWYRAGGVPDTVDGRFDLIASILALVLLRLERDDSRRAESALLTELFVEDMDAQLRQIGIGDLMVGKHIGKLMGALGGRLGALRAAAAGDEAIEDTLLRNLYRGEDPGEAALGHAAAGFRALHESLARIDAEALIDGGVPR